MTSRTVLQLALVFMPMLAEAWLAARNEREQRARGGIEPPGDVYRVMRIAYPAAFAAMIAESAWDPSHAWWLGGLALFAAAKGLKWWAIAALVRQALVDAPPPVFERRQRGMRGQLRPANRKAQAVSGHRIDEPGGVAGEQQTFDRRVTHVD